MFVLIFKTKISLFRKQGYRRDVFQIIKKIKECGKINKQETHSELYLKWFL